LVLLDILFIGCAIGYSVTGQNPLLNYRQNLMSIIVAIIGILLLQIGFVIVYLWIHKKTTRIARLTSTPRDMIDIDEVDLGKKRKHYAI